MSMTTADNAQRLEALERANRVRVERAQIKRRVKAGHLTMGEAFASEWAASAKVGDALKWAPGIGGAKVKAALRKLHIDPNRPIERLTARELLALGAELHLTLTTNKDTQ